LGLPKTYPDATQIEHPKGVDIFKNSCQHKILFYFFQSSYYDGIILY